MLSFRGNKPSPLIFMMFQKFTRVLAVIVFSFVLTASSFVATANAADFNTRLYVRANSGFSSVGFEEGSVAEISNAETGIYLEAISVISPVSGNDGYVVLREVTWDKDWSDSCINQRFNSKDCTFSFDESSQRARLELASEERKYTVRVGQTISIPVRNAVNFSANNNQGENAYFVLTLQNVSYAKKPFAEFRGTVQKSPASNAALSSTAQVSVPSSNTSATTIGTLPSLSLPIRTPGMSAADYLSAAQKVYLNMFTHLQALQTKIANSTNPTSETQTTTPVSQTSASGQGCGPSSYKNVDGVWTEVGCTGVYGQGAGNQQVDVAAGYKGADKSNAVQGSLGHYDENGVYYTDAEYDRTRDADPNVDVRAGQLGVDYCPLRSGFKTICSVSYYDPKGVKLTQTPFNPAAILTVMDRFGIDRQQLEGLEKGMEDKNIPHLPYQMYPGTGSDAGINLTDLANGGLGTAYDWRVDPLCQAKGPTACQQVKANAQLAESLDITPTPGVTKTNVTTKEAQLNDLKRQVVEIQSKI